MRDGSEEGIALIAVLWTLTLLSIIAAALSLEARSTTRIARNVAENATARAAADAGIQRAILDLETDSRKFRADGTIYTWQFASSSVHISIKDEVGKINLNQAPEAVLAALVSSVGVDLAKAQSLADAIADYRDTDNLPRARGAEAKDYKDAGLAWGPKNAPFQSIEELQQVVGMTAEIYARVVPDLTIYSVGAGINPRAAGERLAGILRDAGFKYFVGDQSTTAYSIRAEAKRASGARFAREVIIQILLYGIKPQVLSWKQGVSK